MRRLRTCTGLKLLVNRSRTHPNCAGHREGAKRMSNRPSGGLMSEAAGWITEQLAEEGVMTSADLVELLLGFEWDGLEGGVDADNRAELVATVCESATANGVHIGPSPEMLQENDAPPRIENVPPKLVEQVLSWEDDFLSLAGIRRG